jgi:serralysin
VNDWNVVRGDLGYWQLMHEIGHTLGLSHYAILAVGGDPSHEGHDYSIMSYFAHPLQEPPFYYSDLPQTPMLADVAALQYMYGANFNTRPLDTVYSWSQTTGEFFIDGNGQGAPTDNTIYMTVWDGGGNDTYDFSNYTSDVRADLRPGEWSTPDDVPDGGNPNRSQLPVLDFIIGNEGSPFIFARGSIANAFLFNGDTRSLIENANGGSGNDSLIGNQANNTLHGNGDDDTLFYTGGVDAFFGDAMGTNGDTADFSLSTRAVLINPVAAFRTVIINGQPIQVPLTPGSVFADASGNKYSATTLGGVALASLTGIENLTGSRFGDTITGDTGNNTIKGGDGGDRIFYTGGLDDLNGEGGVDTIDFSRFGSAVSATLVTTALLAEAGTSDTTSITGTLRPIAELRNFENIVGTAFADVLNGSSGVNMLDGGGGADRMAGGSGDDIYIVDNAGDRVDESNGGAADEDTVLASVTFSLINIAQTLGKVENVTLTGTANINATGNALSNVLVGNSGRNTLSGGGDNDDLNGGGGNDQLLGGSGNDTYRFSGSFGSDTISDESGTNDRVVIAGSTSLLGTSRNGNDLTVELSTGTITISDHFTTGTIESLTFNGTTVVLAKGLVGADLPGIITGSNQSETLDGRGGDDFLFGGNGNDVLLGGAGNDRLDGENGRDILDGGTGDDILTGGHSGDSFVFKPGYGHDTITDFSLEDRLDISGFHEWHSISFSGATVELDFGNGDALSISFDGGGIGALLRAPMLLHSWFDL